MSRRALTAIGTIGPFGTEWMAVAALVGVAVLVAATPTVVGVPLLPLAGLGCIGIAAWGYRRHRMGRFLPAGVGLVDPGLLLLAAIAGRPAGGSWARVPPTRPSSDRSSRWRRIRSPRPVSCRSCAVASPAVLSTSWSR